MVGQQFLRLFKPSFATTIELELPKLPKLARTKATAAHASRDGAEVNLLRAWIVFACGIGLYSLSQELVSPRAGSFFNVDVRGDIDRQMSTAEEAANKEEQGKHTMWWRLAHAREEARANPTPSALWGTGIKA